MLIGENKIWSMKSYPMLFICVAYGVDLNKKIRLQSRMYTVISVGG